jgi:hypothetical protein
MRPVPGLCDRCALRYNLDDLKEEYELGRKTGRFTCPQCYDESHPQLDTRFIRVDDKQQVKDPASDYVELADSRRLYAWNPVGCAYTSTCVVSTSRVTVTT